MFENHLQALFGLLCLIECGRDFARQFGFDAFLEQRIRHLHREIQALILGQIRKHRDMAEQGVDRMDPLRAGLLERTQFLSPSVTP